MIGIPNFLFIETLSQKPVVYISSLSKEEAEECTEEVKIAFIGHWKDLKNRNKNDNN